MEALLGQAVGNNADVKLLIGKAEERAAVQWEIFMNMWETVPSLKM
jgi:hypothetical protein